MARNDKANIGNTRSNLLIINWVFERRSMLPRTTKPLIARNAGTGFINTVGLLHYEWLQLESLKASEANQNLDNTLACFILLILVYELVLIILEVKINSQVLFFRLSSNLAVTK
ncbi:hypothetical protein HMSSN036_54320 [Paenibacillus macerans]|nr:hypothetical protein HMSSN036_54320 [Paenibacillus macerans]